MDANIESIEGSILQQSRAPNSSKISDSSLGQSNIRLVPDINDNTATRRTTANLLANYLPSISHSTLGIVGFALFTSIMMTIGVLTVCFTAPKQTSQTCPSKFQPMLITSGIQDSHPRSSAIGDFNNDNHLDIAVANSDADNIAIFLSYGNGTFANKVTLSSGSSSSPYSLVVGDFNNDNYHDIAIANYGTNNIGLFLGYGNGTFAPLKMFSLGAGRPQSIAIADFDSDHNMDIVTANFATNDVAVLLGHGNGTFATQTMVSTGYDSDPKSIVVADFDNDNHTDIAVANHGISNIIIFLGYGNGSFAEQIMFSTGTASNPYSIAVGDLNSDNRLDICVANSAAQNVGIFYGYGNGTFARQVTYSTGNSSSPYSVAVGDFNSDNRLDIAVANSLANNIGVLLPYDNNTFLSQVIYSTGTGSSPYSVTVADFNNDNRSDIVVTNYLSNNVAVLLAFDPTNFQNQTTYSTGSNSRPLGIALADFNNDNWLDIAVANSNDNNIGVLIGYGNGIFANQVTYFTGNDSQPMSIAVGHFNNDHWIDIAVANQNTSNVGILLGYGNGSFASQVTYLTDSEPVSVAVGDFNSDNYLDICVANYQGQNIGILLGYGNGTFASQVTYSTGANSEPYSIALGDFNNDNCLDIVIANSNQANIGVLLGYGNGSFASQVTYSTGANSKSYSVALGDFNNDNCLDIVIANSNQANIGVLLGYGNGSFASQVTYSTGANSKSYSVALGDFNNDNCLDIVIANSKQASIGVLLGYGNGSFANQSTYSTGTDSFPVSVTVGDFNRDNRLDIAVTTTIEHDVGVFIGYGDGSFASVLLYSIGINSYPAAIACGDLNNDHRLDIAVTDVGINNIAVLLAGIYGVIESQVIYSTGSGSSPYSVTVADFNNDSYLDITVANNLIDNVGVLPGYGNGSFGVETMYSTGFGSRPTSVTVGDFNSDHRLDIAVADFATHNIGILFGNANGTFATQTTYSTGDDSFPMSVSVAYFNNDNLLNLVFTNYGTNSVGVFLQHNYSTFANQVTYSCGNGSSLYSLAVGDFNNDKNLDIAVVNYGANDVGVFLGYGNGSFVSQVTYSTGVGSHPYVIALGDFNGDKRLDIAISVWNGYSVGVLLGYGNGTFASDVIYSIEAGIEVISIAVADFNYDGHLDIAFVSDFEGKVGVFLGYGNGSFVIDVTYSIGAASQPRSIAVGDFNKDNQLDITITNPGTDNVGVFLGHGNGSFASQVTYSTGSASQPRSIAVGDFNTDGCLDIIVANFNSYNVGIFFGFGNGSFGNQSTFSTGFVSLPSSVAVGDLNNDNWLDIVVTNTFTSTVGVFFGYGNGSFADQVTYSTGVASQPMSIAVGDFNNDNRLDIAVGNYLTNNVGIFLGYSFVGGIQKTFSTGVNSFPRSVAAGDFNNDSRVDVVVANYGTNSIVVLLGHDDDIFGSQTVYSSGSNSGPISVAVGDFNNDGRLDIVVANSAIDNVCVLFGYGNGTFGSQSTYSTGSDSSPYSVAVGDFDNDSRLDITVANYGTNSVGVLFGYGNGTFASIDIYSLGFNSHPFSVAIGDVNNDNRSDIIVASYGKNTEYILLNMCP